MNRFKGRYCLHKTVLYTLKCYKHWSNKGILELDVVLEFNAWCCKINMLISDVCLYVKSQLSNKEFKGIWTID